MNAVFRQWDKEKKCFRYSGWKVPAELGNLHGAIVIGFQPDTEKFEDPEPYVGLRDQKGKMVFKGDIMRIVLDDGEVRKFIVDVATVEREVFTPPSFDDRTAKVSITGVVFRWAGYDLFPCVDAEGVPDNLKMEIVGSIHQNSKIAFFEKTCLVKKGVFGHQFDLFKK